VSGGVTADHVSATVLEPGVALVIVGALSVPTLALAVPEPVVVK
jgi:hypothetical protein